MVRDTDGRRSKEERQVVEDEGIRQAEGDKRIRQEVEDE